MDTSTQIATDVIKKRIPDSIVTEVDPEESGGFHYIIHDHNGLIMARMGIDTHDCRNEIWM